MGLQQIVERLRDIHQVPSSILTLIPSTLEYDSAEGRCLQKAIDDYSEDRPRRRAKKVLSTGLDSYDLSAQFDEGWEGKTLLKIQLLNEDAKPCEMDDNDWDLDYNLETEKLDVLNFVAGRSPRVPFVLWYFERHTITSDESSVPAKDEEAICQKAAQKVLFIAATRAANFAENSSFQGDGVDYRALSDRYTTLSNKCAAEYDRLLDKKTPAFTPTFVDSDLDTPGGPPRIFHSTRDY